jgi:hypothetical protein
MQAYKEIYIDFNRNSSVLPEEINFSFQTEFQTRQSISTQIKPRGVTISLPDYLIFG